MSSAPVIVTTCMQRLDFLKNALPTWLAHTRFPVVVVDYSCPEGTGAWIRSEGGFGGRVAVAPCRAETIDGRPVFNPARARNTGAAAAMDSAADGVLLFLDADTLLEPGFGDWAERAMTPEAMEGSQCAVVGRPSPLFGALGVGAARFREAGGYDEGFTGWGGEDLELRIRLHRAGLACLPMPEHLMRSIPHSNALRARNSARPDFEAARRLNHEYLDAKLVRDTGRPFRAWVADRSVDCLCVTAPAAHFRPATAARTSPRTPG